MMNVSESETDSIIVGDGLFAQLDAPIPEVNVIILEDLIKWVYSIFKELENSNED